MKRLFRLVEQVYKQLALFFQPSYSFTIADDLPEKLEKHRVYILGEPSDPWAVALECPCGCRAIIQLNLLREAKPRWEYSISYNRAITIKPSVWRKAGCKSHFFIRKGKIVWA